MAHVSKSDFKIARTCPTKLYYKKHGFPSSMDTNEYMAMLADAGFMFGHLAQLLFPEGIEITGTVMEAVETTNNFLINNENITLFEPAIMVNNQLVRVDILKKLGDKIQVIEVKSKSFDSIKSLTEKNYWSKGDMKPYIEDVAYQTKVVREKFPACVVSSFLMMPDTSSVSTFDNLISVFELHEIPANPNSRYRNVEIIYTGGEDLLELLREAFAADTLFVKVVDVNIPVAQVMQEVVNAAGQFVSSVLNDTRIETPISCACSTCEYNLTDETHEQSGFKTCWGELALPKPHILELGQLGNVNRLRSLNNEKRAAGELGCIDELISNGKTSLNDIPIEIVSSNNEKPYYNNRPLYQITKTEEFILADLADEMNNVVYPIHFFDVETSTMCIPLHTGMRPYENVIFQWSCHTISHKGAKPVHSEWLNTESIYPNIEFVRTLKNQLGLEGTFLTWSPYENVQLKSVYYYLQNLDRVEDRELIDWLSRVVKFNDEDATKLLDMHELAKKYYYHPVMGGRTSIKVALPAVLASTKSNTIIEWLQEENLYAQDENGKIINPYKLLPTPTITANGEQIVVREGGAAMMAYQDMIFGLNKNNDAVKSLYIDALKKYCKLDTLSMAIIWQHWEDKLI